MPELRGVFVSVRVLVRVHVRVRVRVRVRGVGVGVGVGVWAWACACASACVSVCVCVCVRVCLCVCVCWVFFGAGHFLVETLPTMRKKPHCTSNIKASQTRQVIHAAATRACDLGRSVGFPLGTLGFRGLGLRV